MLEGASVAFSGPAMAMSSRSIEANNFNDRIKVAVAEVATR